MSASDNYIRDIQTAIEHLSGKRSFVPVKTFDATVVSVDKKSRTCVVDSEKDNIDGLTVRLSPEICDGDINIPQVDSTVTVMMSGITDPYIVNTTWIDGKIIIIADQGYENDGEKQIFNDGAYGGLVRVIDLTKKINTLEKDLNDLKTRFSGWVPVANDGGAALKSATANWFANTIIETKQSDIENESITHGKKL